MKIKKVLIANRGEIALRIMRTLSQMNIESIALYTDIEENDLHVKTATHAVCLGNGTLAETWLNIPLIVQIAREAGADAIHPGYGFLSENGAFARACEQAGIIFIGPHSDVIEKMGSKITASAYAREAGIPLLPRLEGTPSELLSQGPSLGFPLLVKAAAGGGGKGMIRIDSSEMLHQAVFSAADQARRYFADDKVYLEKYVVNPRHIEVQVMADEHGNVVHLFERECTLQRNHQKVVEEAPSVSLNETNRAALLKAAVDISRAVGYKSAGTVEFILDEQGNFYFLEMNTRIQVEHPVTEQITGIDIVKEQILIAMGNPLSFTQQEIKSKGHSIEVRLYAEDPSNGFMPSAGVLRKLVLPRSQSVRCDSAIENSGKVHSSFDPMIAKIIVAGKDREHAINELEKALSGVLVHGISCNLDLLSNIVKDPLYRENKINTHSIADNLETWTVKPFDSEDATKAAALFIWLERYSNGKGAGAWRLAAHEKVSVNKNDFVLFHFPFGESGLQLNTGQEDLFFSAIQASGNKISFTCNNTRETIVFSYSEGNAMLLFNGNHYHVIIPEAVVAPKMHVNGGLHKFADLKASLFGRVLRVNVSENQKVKSGETLLVLESMKMENSILAPGDSVISRINVKEGDQVSDGQILIYFQE